MHGLMKTLAYDELRLSGSQNPLNLTSLSSMSTQLKKLWPLFTHYLGFSLGLNKLFENLVDARCDQHFEANLDASLGKIFASERRILMTQRICAPWEISCHEYKDAIRASDVDMDGDVDMDRDTDMDSDVDWVMEDCGNCIMC